MIGDGESTPLQTNRFGGADLVGERIRLTATTLDHAPALAEAVHDGELWRLWYTNIPEPTAVAAEIERRLDLQRLGTMTPFTAMDAKTGRVIGMTSYMNIDRSGPRLEIGSTWFAKSAQRSGVNSEAKLLMLERAFEDLACLAVELRTHFFNAQSRAAIERLGAKLDGVLRSHQRSRDGSLRDTCVYSIIACEWPTVKTHLRARLSRIG
jgi:RimJ/RimL family protein N-acetyltransferase